jgi:hypothetical protein
MEVAIRMSEPHSPDYYKMVFARLAVVLRIFHRDLNFGFITTVIERDKINIRWAVRRKGYPLFKYDVPITFESLYELSSQQNENLYRMAETLTKHALQLLPKELIKKEQPSND